MTLLTLGDPRIDPRIAAHCRCLASRTIPAPCRTWINVFWATILLHDQRVQRFLLLAVMWLLLQSCLC